MANKRKRKAPSSSSSSSFNDSASSTASSGFISSATSSLPSSSPSLPSSNPSLPSSSQDVAVKAKVPKNEQEKTFDDLLKETELKDSRDAFLAMSLAPIQIDSGDEEGDEDEENEENVRILIENEATLSPSSPPPDNQPPTTADKEEYEVERILMERKESGRYCIKWDGYRLNESTWEGSQNLRNCDKVRKAFEDRQKLCFEIYKSLPNKDEYKGFLDTWFNGIFTRTFAESCVLEDIFIKFCKRNGFGNFYVENWSRSFGLVPDFTFLSESVFSAKAKYALETADSPKKHCDCDGCGKRRQRCKCIQVPITSIGRLRISPDPDRHITECHRKCYCGDECVGKVFQRGRTIPVILFKTPHCGWGLRTAVDIPAKKFVAEYVGLIKLYEECQSIKDLTYLFDIDISNDAEDSGDQEVDGENSSKPPKYVIDATHEGNAARFINHSCDPNLTVVLVKGYYAQKDFARVTFFSNTDIKAGDELTFNYFKHELNPEDVKEATPQCFCGYEECRKYLI